MSISKEELKGSSSEDGSSESGSYEVKSDVEDLPKPARTNKINRGMTYGKGAGINGMPKLFGQKELSEEEADSSAAEEEEKREKKKSKMKKLKINKKEKKDDIDDLGRMASLQNERDLKSIFQNIANMNKMTRPSLSGARVREAKDPKEEKKEEIDPFGRVQKSLVSGEVYENDRKEGDLTFGSYIVISIENEKEQREKDYDRGMKTEHRKFFSKFRISDVVKAEKMSKENYDSNCVFRIIPAAQFSLMNKLREIVTEEIIPQNFELDYENFISEMEDSVDTQDDLMGKPIKYGSKFQLVQESSKRFLSMSTSSSTRVAKIFNNRYVDSQCYDLCFSEYPSMFTHFQFEECSNFQREGNGNVSVDHFFYLSSKIKSKSFYAYNSDKYLVMTQSYKTPLYYNLVRESGTFNEIEDVQTSEVVLIAYANEDYFLNVPHRFDPASGQYIEQNIAFENTRDFNSWFMVEYDEEKQIVHLKHFNTGKYVSIENSDNLEEDVARLVGEVNGERIEETEIIFEPVNTTNTNVSRYTDQCVFKIRANNKGKDNEDNYIRFANEYDREKFGQENDNIFEENDSSKVPLVVRDADSINKYDTFKLIFPTDDTYRELIFCKDSTLRLKEIFKSVDEAKEINEALEKNNHALYKVFLKVYKFVTNDLEGRTNSDYDVDEIVDYRQEMVAKAGFLNQIFDFLDY